MKSKSDILRQVEQVKENLLNCRKELAQILDDTTEIVESHASCIASDEQYDDPELWWSRPINEAMENILQNHDSISENIDWVLGTIDS